jgi:ABC-type antimicrobial peptide transport system permease subunit
MTFVIRTATDPATLVPSVRLAVASVDATQPAYDIQTMQQRLNDNESLIQFELLSLSIFAMLAVLLVTIGLYGVISYRVAQRTREIGIRIALGARPAAILIAVVRESAVITVIGAALGFAVSLALTRFLSATLFGVTPHDPVTLGAVCLLFLVVAMLASYLPAHRAAMVDPIHALRSE